MRYARRHGWDWLLWIDDLLLSRLLLSRWLSRHGLLLWSLGFFGSLLVHLLLVCYLLLIALLHYILIVKDSMRKLLLEDLFIEKLANSACDNGLLKYLSD